MGARNSPQFLFNMLFDNSKILTAFMPLLGWTQNIDPSRKILDALMLQSTSGRYYNEYHPLLTHDNILSLAPDIELFLPLYEDWNVNKNYLLGDIVRGENPDTQEYEYFQAIQANQGQSLDFDADTEYWKKIQLDKYWEWLKVKNQTAIVAALSEYLTAKVLKESARELLETKVFWDSTGNQNELVENDGRFVFYEIRPNRDPYLVHKINRVGIQFDTIGTKTIKCFKSGFSGTFQSANLAYTAVNSVQWFDLDWSIPSDGVYYIGYDQANTPGNAIEISRDISAHENIKRQCIKAKHFMVRMGHTTDVSPISLWDTKNNVYSNRYGSMGLNIDMSVCCDYTQFFLNNKMKFVDLIGYKMAMVLLNTFVHNPNAVINRNESILQRNEIRFEIAGDSQGRPGGLQKTYTDTMKAISFNRQMISKVCLPCGRNGGMRFKHRSSW